jgi:HSP20 family molecular chaperone IbpA
MAPNNNNNNNDDNPFERFFRPFFGSDDDDIDERRRTSGDIFANFPERSNLPYSSDDDDNNNNKNNKKNGFEGVGPESIGNFPDWVTAFMMMPPSTTTPHSSSSSGYQSASWSTLSSYQMHQDQNEVSIDIDMPGVDKKDLNVEVSQNIATQSCTVQWSGQRENTATRRVLRTTTDNSNSNNNNSSADDNSDPAMSSQQQQVLLPTFSNRILLGPNVNCDQLSAHLSKGVLHLHAPVKVPKEKSITTRSVPIIED